MIPPHLKRVATLPCKIVLRKFKNRHFYEVWNETSFKMHTQFWWISFTYLLLQFLVHIKYSAADDAWRIGWVLHLPTRQRSCTPRARDTVRLLELAMPAFIRPDLWPPNSPDFNPVDYKIWSVVQQRVYQSLAHYTDELKQRLVHV